MTARKPRKGKVRATEDAVFGYRPPSSIKRMNNSDDLKDDIITDDDEPLKLTIAELRTLIRNVLG